MTIDKRVIIDKGTTVPGTGFEIKGRTSEGSNSRLLYVHHNNTGGIDEVCYHGEQKDNDHLATVGFVNSTVSRMEQQIADLTARLASIEGLNND